jgi:hypothetical protein
MKYYTEKERNEIQALMILAKSDIQELSAPAKDALKKVENIGVEIIIDEEAVIDERTMDDNSILADYVVVYDEYIAHRNNDTKNFWITIMIRNLLTGEVIFDSYYRKHNNGEGIYMRENCTRKKLRKTN